MCSFCGFSRKGFGDVKGLGVEHESEEWFGSKQKVE
jgi:hypothetical protein